MLCHAFMYTLLYQRRFQMFFSNLREATDTIEASASSTLHFNTESPAQRREWRSDSTYHPLKRWSFASRCAGRRLWWTKGRSWSWPPAASQRSRWSCRDGRKVMGGDVVESDYLLSALIIYCLIGFLFLVLWWDCELMLGLKLMNIIYQKSRFMRGFSEIFVITSVTLRYRQIYQINKNKQSIKL